MNRKPASLVLLALFCAALALGACGKRGPPERPGGGSYPGFYPNPQGTLTSGVEELPPPPAPEDDDRDANDTYFFPRVETKVFESE